MRIDDGRSKFVEESQWQQQHSFCNKLKVNMIIFVYFGYSYDHDFFCPFTENSSLKTEFIINHNIANGLVRVTN